MKTYSDSSEGIRCPACDKGPMFTSGIKDHVARVGEHRVCDSTGSGLVCDACGEYAISDRQAERYELRAAAIVLRDGGNTVGTVMIYARKALALSTADLAKLLDVRESTVLSWENDGMAAPWIVRLALAGTLEGVAAGILDIKKLVEKATDEPWTGAVRHVVISVNG